MVVPKLDCIEKLSISKVPSTHIISKSVPGLVRSHPLPLGNRPPNPQNVGFSLRISLVHCAFAVCLVRSSTVFAIARFANF
jgi:hypothetical protein